MAGQKRQSSAVTESEREHARKHRARANHIARQMSDLPASVSNEMPLTYDPWELAAAERCIRQEHAARLAASRRVSDPAKAGK
jgi:hypothetical protein